MVESVIVISTFILFFMGMVFFRSLYEQKLRVMRISRAASVAYAMGACQGDALASVKQDLAGTVDNNSGKQQGSADMSKMTPTPNSGGQNGNGGSQSAGKMLSGQGVVGDPIAGVSVQGNASASTMGYKHVAGSPVEVPTKTGFFAQNVHSDSYMSCGEDQHKGDPGGFLDYVKGEFTSAF
jgi:hypothetical protein